MDAQLLAVVLIVGGAVLFVARRAWRAVQSARRTSAGGCDAGCGCDSGAVSRRHDWAER